MYFPQAFHYMYLKMGFGGVEGEDVKIPCIRVCQCVACQNRCNGLSARSVERFCVQTNKETKKKCVVTLAMWGEVTPGAILTKCSTWADMVDVITRAIFDDCRLRGVGVMRG